MLSLSTEHVREYWQSVSPELAKLFDAAERAEDWTLDSNPDIADRLVQFGLRLADPAATLKLAGGDKNELIFFLVYISSSKAFRIVQWMDGMHEGLGTQLLNSLLEQEGDGAFVNVVDPVLAGTLMQRLRVIRNTAFFHQLLAPSLLESILRSIESYREEKEKYEA